MSFYDDARQKVRDKKMANTAGKQVTDITKTGYSRSDKQKSKKQKEAKHA